MAKRSAKAAPKTASKRRGAGNGGIVPPVEHRFKEGNQAAVGYGRPRKLAEFQELIKDTLAEDASYTDPVTGCSFKGTRAQAMIRTMLVKSPSDRIALLEYIFGKVTQPTQARTWEDDVIDLLIEGKVTEAKVFEELPDYAPRLIAAAKLRRNENGAVANADPA